MGFRCFRLDRKNITEEKFKQILLAESEDGYNEEQLRNIWIDDEKNDNFVCVDGDRIIAHISYNPSSKRRNGSIYMFHRFNCIRNYYIWHLRNS